MENSISGIIKLLRESDESGKKVVIWSAGGQGITAYQFCQDIGIEIDFFVDKSYATKEDGLLGKEVLNPEYINCITSNECEQKEIFVLVAGRFHEEITEQLVSWGYVEGTDFTSFSHHIHAKRVLDDKKVRRYINSFYPDKLPLFSRIEVETINRCNMDCQFCPVNRNVDTRDYKLMEEELFESILNQLQEFNYDGNFAFHSNNEPFMDKRLIRFMYKTKEKIPNATLYLYTNGTLLTLDIFKEIIRILDHMIIDNYSDDFEFVAQIKEIYEYCKTNDAIGKKVKILKRRKNQLLTTRGGQAPNREKIRMRDITCICPFTQLIVRPDGKISLCCNDARGIYTLGDLKEEKIADIWYGEKYTDIRKKILAGRENLSLCGACDTIYPLPRPSDGKYKIPDTTCETLLEVWP